MKTLYTFFLLTLSLQVNAQTYEWTKALGGVDNDDISYSVATDAIGNVYIAGTCASSSVDFDPSSDTAFIHSQGAFVAKYDASGNYLWVIHAGIAECLSMTIDPSANIYITGNFNDSIDIDPTPAITNLYANGTTDIFLSKYDSAGSLIWGHSFGGPGTDYGIDVAPDNTGNIILTGYFSNTIDFDPSSTVNNLTSNGDWDGFLAKYDASGNYQWAISMGSTNIDVCRSVDVDGLGNIYLTGIYRLTVDFDPSATVNTLAVSGGADIFTAKYDPVGNYLWAVSIGNSTSTESAYSISVGQKYFYLTGSFGGILDFDPGPGVSNLNASGTTDIFYAKYDSLGHFIFANNIGGSMDDRGNDIKIDENDNIYLTGRFKATVDFDPGIGISNETSVASSSDIFLAKYNTLGNFLWVKTIGSSNEDIGRAIAINDGDIYLTGSFMSTVNFNPDGISDNHASNGARDIFLTKYSNIITNIPDKAIKEIPCKLYPNPTNSTLFCEVIENTQLYIYNAAGSLVHSQSLNTGKHSLDISYYPTGLYLVRSSLLPTGTILVKQ